MKPSVAIGIDLGGTNLKAAVVDSTGRVLAWTTMPLQVGAPPDAVIADMAGLVDPLLSDASATRSALVGVGVGAPGPMRLGAGRIVRAANLPGWVEVPLRDRLRERLQTPVAFDNDGNAAAVGEFWVGAGRECTDLVMLTLGSGVGAGVILDGHLLHGHFENAAELGHTIVMPDGIPCACGQRGCLEQYASAGGVARRVLEAIRAGEPSLLAESAGKGEPIDASRIADAARRGDALSERVWDEACRYLAVACINIQHSYNPALIVLGGGMSQAGPFLLDRVREHVTRQRWSLHDDLPAVTLAKLGYDAGVIGAARLAWQQKGALPRRSE